MDLETENRIASILLKEAAELRRQAQHEGALAYLRQPTVRGRPNSRFLTATVRGIQQANRAVEMNEMWHVRQKELELDERCKKGSRCIESCTRREGDGEFSQCENKRRDLHSSDASCSSTKQLYQDHHARDDEGLRDEELEKFLHSRVKRGRGSVGSRMDETGPYLSASANHFEDDERYHRARSILGPEKRLSLKPSESSDESSHEDKRNRYNVYSEGSKMRKRSKKHSSKEKSREERKKRREKRHKH